MHHTEKVLIKSGELTPQRKGEKPRKKSQERVADGKE